MIRSASTPVLARGGGSKPALSNPVSPGEVTVIETRELSGITEYQPSEYTLTALAGTAIAELERALREEGQYLPFDPILVDAGSTVGGTIAAGVNGSGRLRYGGIRDFLLGVTYLDGDGEPVRGGGKVVKNAAGFDLPKLMVGSLGRLGILTEATFKVFPAPAASATLSLATGDLARALEMAVVLLRSSVELSALDLAPPDRLFLRISGVESALEARLQALRARVEDQLGSDLEITTLLGAADAEHWRSQRELAWAPSEASLVKVPVTAAAIPRLEEALQGQTGSRVYCGGVQQLLLSWAEPLSDLHSLLERLGLAGLVLRGETLRPRLGRTTTADCLEDRVRKALDPRGRFAPGKGSMDAAVEA